MTDQTVLTQQDVSWLEKFRQSALEFRTAYEKLMAMESDAARAPQLEAEYQDLYQQGSIIRATIEQVTRTVDSVTGFFSDAWDAGSSWLRSLLNGVPQTAPRPRGALGVIPLVPIAAISAAVGLMGKWVSDVYVFERKLSEAKRLESQGLSPQQAARQAQGYSAGGLFDDLAMPLLIGGGIWLFVTQILPRMRK